MSLQQVDIFDEAVKQVANNTEALFPLWMLNWAENLQEARFGDSLDKLYQRQPSERVLVVGRGPSLKKHNHLDLLEKYPFNGEIVASDGALPLLAERGIVPYLSMTVDGNVVIAKWFDGPTARLGSKVKAVLPVTVNPKTVNAIRKLGGHIYWYVPEIDSDSFKGLTRALQLQTLSPKNQTGLSRHNAAGCCGLSAMVLAATILRAKEICLIGMDNGYLPETPLGELHYHDNVLKAVGYSAEQAAKFYRIYEHPLLGCSIVDVVFEVYRRGFQSLAKQIGNMGIRLYNATGGGCLVEEGVRIIDFEEYLKTLP